MKKNPLFSLKAAPMLAAAIASLLASHAASAANATWNGTIDTTWADAGNWSAATPGSGNTATFSNAGNSNTTLDLGAGVTITTVLFDTDGAAAYTIGKDGPGSQTLTLNASGAITLTPSVTTSQLFDANLTLGTAAGTNSFTVTNNSTAVSQLLVLAGAVSSTTTGAKTLTVSGAGNTEMTGIISTGSATTFALTKSGPGTLTLKGANSYNGLTSIAGGTLQLNGATGSLNPLSGLFLGVNNTNYIGGTAFIYDNVGATGAISQTMASLGSQISQPNDNTVQVTRSAAQPASLIFTTVTSNATENGNVINFVTKDTAAGGVNGTDYKIVLADQTTYRIIKQTAYFNGGEFAVYDAGPDLNQATPLDGFVRGINYGTDANSATSAGGTSFAATHNQEITGDITSQGTVALGTTSGGTNGTLKIVGTSNLALASGAILTINNTGNTGATGILKTGGGKSTITGGSQVRLGIQADIRVDGTTDELEITTGLGSISGAARFLKSGAGKLILSGSNTYVLNGIASGSNGTNMFINAGVLEIGGSATLSPPAATSAQGTLAIAADASLNYNSSSSTSSIRATIAGRGSLSMTGTGTLTLSGPNSYTGGTTVSAGILTFLTTASKTGSTTVDAGSTLGLGVGGSGTFTSANVDSLFAGTLAGVTMGPAVNVALDTTHGDFTYATDQSAARSLTKLGANTLTLSGTNSYSGGTHVMAGTLTFLNPAAKTGSITVAAGATLGLGVGAGLFSLTDLDALWANTLANVSMDATSGVGIDTTAGDLSYATSQSGSRSLTKLGANTLTVSGDNSYTGLTTVSVGTLKLGAAGSGANSPLGTAGAGTLVRSGAALDLNGFTLATAEALTLNGTGVSSGGALTNTSGTAVTFNGLITLGSASRIVAGNGDILLPNTGNITGNTFGLTLDGSATGNSLAGNLITTTGTLTKSGSGTWAISGNSTHTGATTINAGTLKLTGGSLANTAISVSGTGILAVQPGSSTTINVGTTVTATGGATLNLGAQTFDMADGFASTVNLRQGSTFANNALTVTSGATFRMNLGEAAADLLAVIKKASVSGTINVTLDTAGASALTAGTYNLITAASGLTSSSPTWQFSGGGVTRTVTVGAGSYDLTLNASDTAVSVTVVDSSASTPYDNWAASKGLDGTPGKEKGLTDDPDGDGHNNLAEFAFNGDPLSGSDNGQVHVLQADSDADGDSTKELILTLAVRKSTGAFTAGAPATATSATDGISYAIEGSLNLSAFDATVTPVGFVDPGVALTDATYYEYRSFSLSGSNGLNGKGFLRARAVK